MVSRFLVENFETTPFAQAKYIMKRCRTVAIVLFCVSTFATLGGRAAVGQPNKSDVVTPPRRPADFKPYQYEYTTEQLRENILGRPDETSSRGMEGDSGR